MSAYVMKEVVAKLKKKNDQKEVDIKTLQNNIKRAEQVNTLLNWGCICLWILHGVETQDAILWGIVWIVCMLGVWL